MEPTPLQQKPGEILVFERYERQGILVEAEAIEKAESECLADAERRKRQAERRALRAAGLDEVFVQQFAEVIRQQFPKCPIPDANGIAEHASARQAADGFSVVNSAA